MWSLVSATIRPRPGADEYCLANASINSQFARVLIAKWRSKLSRWTCHECCCLRTPPGHPSSGSLHGFLHFITAGVGFACLIAGCFVLSRRFYTSGDRRLGAFSIAVGALFLAAFAGIASGSTSAVIVLSFTAAVILAWRWLSITAAHLRRASRPPVLPGGIGPLSPPLTSSNSTPRELNSAMAASRLGVSKPNGALPPGCGSSLLIGGTRAITVYAPTGATSIQRKPSPTSLSVLGNAP